MEKSVVFVLKCIQNNDGRERLIFAHTLLRMAYSYFYRFKFFIHYIKFVNAS